MDHELILEGPIPYFSTPEIWFAKCGCGAYATDKCASKSDAIQQHAEHAKAKYPTNVGSERDKHALEGTEDQSAKCTPAGSADQEG